jgi:hypothetical protein
MTEEQSPKKRWPWWGKVLLILSPFFLLIVVAMLFEAGGKRAYNQALQEARSLGGPVTLEEIEAVRRVWPADKNGAPIILSLAGKLTPAPEDEKSELLPLIGTAEMPPLGEKWSAAVDKAVASYLAQQFDTLTAIDRLLNYEGGRFPITLTPNPLGIRLSNLGLVRASAKLKSLQVTREAMHGNTASLATDLEIMLRHGRLLAEDPLLISGLVRVATDALAVDTLERVLAQAPADARQLQQIQPMLKAVEDEDRLSWAIRGERAMVIGAANWLIAGGGQSSGAALNLPVSASTPLVRGWLRADLATVIRLWSPLVQAKDSRQRARAAEQMDSSAQALSQYHVLVKELVPSIRRCFELDLRTVAMARAARTALAAERYRLDKGRFPQRLDDLVPGYLDAVPVDPFDDKPMCYRVDADAVIIYSVAEDKKDDGGGVQYRVPSKADMPDWGFVLLEPEFRGRPASTTAPATQEAEARETLSRPHR